MFYGAKGAALVKDPVTGFLQPGEAWSIAGFTGEKKAKALDALKKRYNVAHACNVVGISRTAFYEALHRDAAFGKAYRDIIESHVDDAEANMVDLSKKPNGITAAIFLLKNRRRAIYGERIGVFDEKPELLTALMDRMGATVVDAEIIEPEKLQSGYTDGAPSTLPSEGIECQVQTA